MKGPFELRDWGAVVLDAAGNAVARGDGSDEVAERENAQMVCDALNAIFYTARLAPLVKKFIEERTP